MDKENLGTYGCVRRRKTGVTIESEEEDVSGKVRLAKCC